MKTFIISFVFCLTAFNITSYAQLPSNSLKSDIGYEEMEKNYLVGLNSDISGLKVSSAYYLGEMKSEKAVIPLLKLFRETNNDGARLVAAWSLLKIGDERGIFIVKKYIELGDCDGIRCMLQYMYMDYSLKTYGKVIFN